MLLRMLTEFAVVAESVATFLTYINLGSSFSEGELVGNSVDTGRVGFERATLGERFVTHVAFEWFHSCGRNIACIKDYL